MIDLDTCPFCKSDEARVIEAKPMVKRFGKRTYAVVCNWCGASGPDRDEP